MIIKALKYLFGFDRHDHYHPRILMEGRVMVNHVMLERMLNNGDVHLQEQRLLTHHVNLMPRVALSSSRSTYPAVLDALSRDKSELVRGNVAANRTTPQHVIDRLATDRDDLVRRMALSELDRRREIARNMGRTTS